MSQHIKQTLMKIESLQQRNPSVGGVLDYRWTHCSQCGRHSPGDFGFGIDKLIVSIFSDNRPTLNSPLN